MIKKVILELLTSQQTWTTNWLTFQIGESKIHASVSVHLALALLKDHGSPWSQIKKEKCIQKFTTILRTKNGPIDVVPTINSKVYDKYELLWATYTT